MSPFVILGFGSDQRAMSPTATVDAALLSRAVTILKGLAAPSSAVIVAANSRSFASMTVSFAFSK